MLDWLRYRLVPRLIEAFNRWSADDGFLLAAALSYYMALSFFPLLLVLISGLGLIMRYTGWGQDAQQRLLEFIAEQTAPQVAQQVAELLGEMELQAVVSGPVGLVMLLFTAMTIFAQFDRAFDRIWNIDQDKTWGVRDLVKELLFYRFKAFLMLLTVGLLVFVTFLLGIIRSTLAAKVSWLPFDDWLWSLVQIGTTLLFNWLLFTVLYRTLPKVHVEWSHAARGALLAAILWEISRLVLTFAIGNSYGAYGAVGSFLSILLWVYVASAILFYGAEYVQVLGEEEPPDQRQEPAPHSP